MFWRRFIIAALAAVLLMPALPSFAQKGKRKGAGAKPVAAKDTSGTARVLPPINFTEYRLPNGLRVILHEDHSTPIVGVNLWYHVGSKNEEVGRTGFAHLFEHMMFQGFKGYDLDYIPVLQEIGGAINGSTAQDRTNYWEVVPSNFLETALFMEAGRMNGLLDAMTQTKLDNQRDVVKNEKRQRIDNQPYGVASYKITEAMYPPGHPYHWSPIGSMEDLSAASLDDVKGFFRRYYVPNNASLAVSGDFDPAETRRMIEKYFGIVPRGVEITRPMPPPPHLDKEIREQVEDRVQLPRVYMSWHSVPQYTKDEAAIDMLASILGGGKSSRLYKTLIYDKQIAQDAFSFNNTSEIAGLFQLVATAKPGHTLAEIEEIVNAEIARLKADGPTPEEMSRAYNAREASFVYGLQTVGGFGGKDDQLNGYATFLNKPGYFEEDLARYRRVTAADVRHVANEYLTDKRYLLSVVPRAAGPTSAAGVAPASPRDAIATPSQQTAGAPQAGSANAASQTTPTGAPQPGTSTDRPSGAQTITKAEARATQPGGAAPPNSAASGGRSMGNGEGGGTATGTGRMSQGRQKPKQKEKSVDLSLLPKPKPDPVFTLPGVQRRKLSNGLEVLVVEHHEVPIVSMNLVVKMGGAGDPANQGGLASLTADMLDEGTATRSSLEISNQLTSIGSSLATNAGWDSSSATLRTLTRHLDRALDIYADVITNPAFPDKDLQRLRLQRQTFYKQRRDNPESIAGLVYQSVLYGRNHPYGHSLSGDAESLGAITGADVRKFYETFYRPNNSALIVVGDVRADVVVQKLEKAFAKWQSAHVPAVDVAAAPVARERTTLYVVDRPGSVQSVINIGQVGVPRSNPDYFPLLVMNRILGGASSARINLNLREDKGYTYGATSNFDFRRGAGPFTASAPVQGFSTKESVEEFLKELRGIRGEIPVRPDELEGAKQSIIRGFPRSFETPEQIAGRLETVVTYGLPDEYFNAYIQSVQAVTLEDVNRVANRYLDPSRMAVVIVGDRQAIEKGLRSLDEIGDRITFVDSEGRPNAPGSMRNDGGAHQ